MLREETDEMLTGLSMRRSSRQHLAKVKILVNGHSCDRNEMRGAMVRGRCALVTSKPEGIGLLLGLCDGFFAHGEGGSGDNCGFGHSGRRERGKGPIEKWTIELK